MNLKLREFYKIEIKQAIQLYKRNELDQSFLHLERAHIIAQSFIIPHTRSHVWMLKIGWKRRDFKEVIGQITRIIASVLFSRIWVPIGNTGGANVNPLKPMPIPKDLQKFLDS